MDGPWQMLRRGGLPLGAPGPGPAPSAEQLAAAVSELLSVEPAPRGRERDALAAFILAWRRQWPRTFSRAFGASAPAAEAWARASIEDPNRTLKLSRIAMAHLAGVL